MGHVNATGIDWSALADALQQIERLSPDDSGLLEFGMEQQGAIFVEKGRICWVAASGLGRRLRHLILAHSSIDKAELDRVCERCRTQGGVVGQTLVAEGLLEPAELEAALRQHSTESLIELCRAPLPTRFRAHAGRGYTPRFTFRPVELLLDTIGASFPELRAEARRELDSLEVPGLEAAAFVFDAARDCLLPVVEHGQQTIAGLRALGRWASSMPHASLELAAAPSLTLAATEKGDSVLVWWRAGILFAVLCEDRARLAAVASRHMATE